jgi:AcrR family transcriptional regulator
MRDDDDAGPQLSDGWLRHRAHVRGQIERAAVELCADRSPDDVTVDEITRAAGISPRTFFRYFPSRGDVFWAFPLRLTVSLCGPAAERTPTETVTEAFIGAATEVADEFEDELLARWAALVWPHLPIEGWSSERVIDEYVKVVAKRENRAEDDPKVRVWARALQSTGGWAFGHWLEVGGSRTQILAEAWEILALLNDPSRQTLTTRAVHLPQREAPDREESESRRQPVFSGPAPSDDEEGATSTALSQGWLRRRAQVASSIERAALDLCADRAPDDVTVEEIARAAGFSQRTFFRYFRTRDDVFAALPLRHTQYQCAQAAMRPETETVLEAFIAAAEERDDEFEDNLIRHWAESVLPSLPVDTWSRGHLADTYAKAIAEREHLTEDDPRVQIWAGAVASASALAFREWMERGGSRTAFIAAAWKTLAQLPGRGEQK